MIAAWMLYSVGVGVLVAAAALAAEQCCRILRLPGRGVWLAAIAATVLLSGAVLWQSTHPAPATSVAASLPASATRVPEPAVGVARVVQVVGEIARSARTLAVSALDGGYAAAASAAERVAGPRALLGAWLLSSALALLLLAFAQLRLSRARRSWRPHRVAGVGVLLSQGFGPAVIGLLRSAIVVPQWLLSESLEAQQVIVQHEDEHRRARDPLLLAAASLGVCLLPWNPVLWWLLARLRLAVELDCDGRTLRRGVTALSYGSLLLEIASRAPVRLLGAPALADSRIHLERRLLAMTEKTRTTGLTRPVLAGGAALLLAAAACKTDVPTAAAIEEMDATAARQQAEQAGLLPTPRAGQGPLYIVDGKVVTEAEARVVAPEDLASIEVLKGDAASLYGKAGENGVILMKKRSALATADLLPRTADKAAVARAKRPAETGPQRPGAVVARQQAKDKLAGVVVVKKAAGAKLDASAAKPGAVIVQGKKIVIARTAADRVEASAAAQGKEAVLAVPSLKAPTAQAPAKTSPDVASPALKAPTAQAPAKTSPDLTAPALEGVRLRTPAKAGEQPAAIAEDNLPMKRANPFIVVDGKLARPSYQLPSIASDEILSVEVVKGEEAIRRYGARAVNGAIVITTKKGARK